MQLYTRFFLVLSLVVTTGSYVVPSRAAADTLDPYNPVDVETRVRTYFADVPAMPAIAKCESGFRQYDGSGAVLFDPSYSMIGVFQISSAHLPESLSLGMDVMTLDGNLAYARHLYEADGIDPWMSSFACWGSKVQPVQPTTSTTSANPTLGPAEVATSTTTSGQVAITTQTTSGLSFGMVSSNVLELQKMLNQAGFVVASNGVGSPGQETTKFGSLTRDAVRRFQCAKSIVCSGDESTTGYGLYDARTQSALVTTAAITTNPAVASTQALGVDKTTQIAQVESQIASLTAQLDLLNQRLSELTR